MTASEVSATTGAGLDLDAIFESLADRLGQSARAAAVFGEAVERDGVTVIPVARACWGVGGGGGREPVKRGDGMGGGGGALVSPVGYIEIRGGAARFKPIFDLKVLAGLGLAAGALLLFALIRRAS